LTTLRSVVIAGGGTAGHIEPALALADAQRRADPHVQITALGTSRGLETTLVPARGYPLEQIPSVPLPRKPTPALLRVPGNVGKAISAAADVIDKVRADVVVGFGSYVALPAYLAARRRGVPFVVHEANMRPGIGNKIGARFTHFVGVAFDGVDLPHARTVGMPLRLSISTLDRVARRAEARAHFGLRPDLPTLFVTGGSQGAGSINTAMAAAAPALVNAGVQVLHMIGKKNTLEPNVPPGAPYVVVKYVERMDLAYAAADLALCRAGAMTVSELCAVGLPAAYVPLPIGNGEQRLNAQPVVEAGGGLLVDDRDLTPEWIVNELLPFLTDPVRLVALGNAAAKQGRRDGDETLAGLVREAVDTVTRKHRQ
jgi:UDP-N-acetylglucosamine--N-acetylmuramyl-(pentapeptide) pyrophosphoryl-undecaprenol N-acetylglucosamine transferase